MNHTPENEPAHEITPGLRKECAYNSVGVGLGFISPLMYQSIFYSLHPTQKLVGAMEGFWRLSEVFSMAGSWFLSRVRSHRKWALAALFLSNLMCVGLGVVGLVTGYFSRTTLLVTYIAIFALFGFFLKNV